MSPNAHLKSLQGSTRPIDLEGLLNQEPEPKKKSPKTSTHKTGRNIPNASLRPLTVNQKKNLGILSGAAFATHRKYGNVPEGMTARKWRHEQRLEAIGTSEIKETLQCHYRRLRGHFKALNGDNSPETLADLTSTDESDARAAIVRDIRSILAGMAQTVHACQKMRMHGAEAYALKIAKDRATGLPPQEIGQVLKTFNVAKLDGIRYTLRNRLNAWRGVGSSATRNESQRES